MLKRVAKGSIVRRVDAPSFEVICMTNGVLTLHNIDNQTSTKWTPSCEEIECNRYKIVGMITDVEVYRPTEV